MEKITVNSLLLELIQNGNQSDDFILEHNEPEDIILAATYCNYIDLCEKAKAKYDSNWNEKHKKKYDIFNNMLLIATRQRNKEMCKKSRHWGAKNFNEMLYIAAECGFDDICEIAKNWGAKDFDVMLIIANENRNESIRKLARIWWMDANISDKEIISGSTVNSRYIHRLAKKWFEEKK